MSRIEFRGSRLGFGLAVVLAGFAFGCGDEDDLGGSGSSEIERSDDEGDWAMDCAGLDAGPGPEEMDILNVRAVQQGGAVVTITFNGDNETWMADNDVSASGVGIGVLIELEGGKVIDTLNKTGGGFKVSGGGSGLSWKYGNMGADLELTYDGFSVSQIKTLTASSLRYDSLNGTFCDEVLVENG